jgi:glutathione S-transferase
LKVTAVTTTLVDRPSRISTVKLYYSPGACSLSPHIVAEEAGIPVELEKVDLRQHKTQNGEDYYQVNPKGYVPALKLDDGTVLTEGPAIVQYLADQKPASHLAPANGTIARYQLMEWLGFINSELHKNFSPLFRDGPEDVKSAAKANIAKRFGYVDKVLANNDYLLGKFSVADAYLFVMTNWATAMKLDLPSHVAAFRKRMLARPKVRAAMKAEGLPVAD